tara:strand:+ start:44139 stop:44444 length:306 start_codon:yes stop_codon:yes gene_type:complete
MFTITTEQEVVTKEVTEVEVSLLGYIGHKIKTAREDQGLNIAQLSRVLFTKEYELSGTTLSKIEKGACPVKLQDLIALCDGLNISFGSVIPVEVLTSCQED